MVPTESTEAKLYGLSPAPGGTRRQAGLQTHDEGAAR